MSTTPLRKITVKTVHGRIDVRSLKEETKLYDVSGVVMGVVNSTSKFNAGTEKERTSMSFKFSGQFTAVRPDGEKFLATVLYLPSPMDSALGLVIAGQNGKMVKISFSLYAMPSPTPIGYEYRVQNNSKDLDALFNASGDDIMAALEEL